MCRIGEWPQSVFFCLTGLGKFELTAFNQYTPLNIHFDDAASHKLPSNPWVYDVQILAPDLRGFAPPFTSLHAHYFHLISLLSVHALTGSQLHTLTSITKKLP